MKDLNFHLQKGSATAILFLLYLLNKRERYRQFFLAILYQIKGSAIAIVFCIFVSNNRGRNPGGGGATEQMRICVSDINSPRSLQRVIGIARQTEDRIARQNEGRTSQGRTSTVSQGRTNSMPRPLQRCRDPCREVLKSVLYSFFVTLTPLPFCSVPLVSLPGGGSSLCPEGQYHVLPQQMYASLFGRRASEGERLVRTATNVCLSLWPAGL